MSNIAQTLSAMKNTKDMNSGQPGNIFKIDVTDWTVAFDNNGNVLAQCKLQPEAGVTIYSAAMTVSLAEAPDKPVFWGGAGNGGTNNEWFVLCGSPFPGIDKGSTVIATITGTASSSAYGYAFQQHFTL